MIKRVRALLILVTACSSTSAFAAEKDVDAAIDFLMIACSADRQVTYEVAGDGSIKLLLKRGVEGSVTVRRSELNGFLKGTDEFLVAEQADKIRECMKNSRDLIVRELLGYDLGEPNRVSVSAKRVSNNDDIYLREIDTSNVVVDRRSDDVVSITYGGSKVFGGAGSGKFLGINSSQTRFAFVKGTVTYGFPIGRKYSTLFIKYTNGRKSGGFSLDDDCWFSELDWLSNDHFSVRVTGAPSQGCAAYNIAGTQTDQIMLTSGYYEIHLNSLNRVKHIVALY